MKITFVAILIVGLVGVVARANPPDVSNDIRGLDTATTPRIVKNNDGLIVHLPTELGLDVSTTAFSADDKTVVFQYGGGLYFIDMQAGRIAKEIGSATLQVVDEHVVSPNGKLLAFGSLIKKNPTEDDDHGEVVVLELQTGRQVFSVSAKVMGSLSPMAFSPDSKCLFYRAADKVIKIDLATGKEVQRWIWSDLENAAAIIEPMSQRVQYSSDRRWMWQHDFSEHCIIDTKTGSVALKMPRDENRGIRDAAFGDKDLFRDIDYDGKVETWNITKGEIVSKSAPQELFSRNAWCCFLPNGNDILVVDQARIGIMDADTGKMYGWKSAPGVSATHSIPMFVSRDGCWLAIPDPTRKRELIITRVPTRNELKLGDSQSPSTPVVKNEPPANVPSHDAAALNSPAWWLDMAKAEARTEPQLIKVYFGRAYVAARAKDEAGANAALTKAQSIWKQHVATTQPEGPYSDKTFEYAQKRVSLLLKGKDYDKDIFAIIRQIRTKLAPTEPDPEAAALRNGGNTTKYQTARAPLVKAINDADGARDQQEARFKLFIFDIQTQHYAAAAAGAKELHLNDEESGNYLASMELGAIQAKDLEALRFLATLSMPALDYQTRRILPMVVAAHIVDRQPTQLLTWITTLPSADVRCFAYLSVAEIVQQEDGRH